MAPDSPSVRRPQPFWLPENTNPSTTTFAAWTIISAPTGVVGVGRRTVSPARLAGSRWLAGTPALAPQVGQALGERGVGRDVELAGPDLHGVAVSGDGNRPRERRARAAARRARGVVTGGGDGDGRGSRGGRERDQQRERGEQDASATRPATHAIEHGPTELEHDLHLRPWGTRLCGSVSAMKLSQRCAGRNQRGRVGANLRRSGPDGAEDIRCARGPPRLRRPGRQGREAATEESQG